MSEPTVREQLIGSRFSYVQYDEQANQLSAAAKDLCQQLEGFIEDEIEPGRAQSLAITNLETCFMWIGKGIRDAQIKRNKEPKNLQTEPVIIEPPQAEGEKNDSAK